MKIVTTLHVVNVASGTVRLSIDQSSRRINSLARKDDAKDVFEIVRPIQFKAGESFGIAAIPKELESALDWKSKETDMVRDKSVINPGKAAHSPGRLGE